MKSLILASCLAIAFAPPFAAQAVSFGAADFGATDFSGDLNEADFGRNIGAAVGRANSLAFPPAVDGDPLDGDPLRAAALGAALADAEAVAVAFGPAAADLTIAGAAPDQASASIVSQISLPASLALLFTALGGLAFVGKGRRPA